MPQYDGSELIRQAQSDPQGFLEGGRDYEIVEAVWAGLPLDEVEGLLVSNDPILRAIGAEVVSELGGDARALISKIAPLSGDLMKRTRYCVLETLAVCAQGDAVEEYYRVPIALQDDEFGIRQLAMRLLVHAQDDQLEAARSRLSRPAWPDELHGMGLGLLLDLPTNSASELAPFLQSEDPLMRKYAAIALGRRRRAGSEVAVRDDWLIDQDLQEFFKDCGQWE